jgi:hypothetical protein
VRTGGWGKHNSNSCGAFRKAKYEKLRRQKSEGGAGIPFPPTPFPSRPARAFSLAREARRQFRSKKFRAKFKISHQSQLSPFWGRVASRLRRSAFGLCALRKAKKSHGSKKEMEMDLSFSYLK